VPWILALSTAFPPATGPQRFATLVHTPVELSPSRAACLPTALPTRRLAFRLPQVLGPFNGIPRACPTVRRVVRPRLGSALGFSQPLSGFLAVPSFAAMFRAATVPGILPSELSPRRDRVPLSRPPCSPAVIHQHAIVHRLCALSPPVSSTPTLTRSCLSPRDGYELPFHGPRPASRLLWAPSSRITTFCQLHLLRSFPPPTSPFSTSPGCPVLVADTLLVLFPSRVFSNHTSGP
jgi:hypothetical protein